ncbi:MAG: dTMP kinase [Parachlamydiaceae bacterium]
MTTLPFKGRFITLEGGEGSGKTTLLHQLALYLTDQGFDVLITREPGGTILGEMIRDLVLQHNEAIAIHRQAELLLFLAARAQHIHEKILPALEAGHVVLCDRFNDSTIAYQGGARGLGIESVENLCHLICGSVCPQLTLFLDVPPSIGLARSRNLGKEHAASGELDRIESEALAFHKKIQESFEALAKKDPLRIYTINAAQSQERVRKEAISALERFFLLRN